MNFYKLKEVFEKFEIPLPQLPGHMKHFERCIYYFELCRALYEFRQRYGLTPVELCVFLYGFAPRFLENFLVSDLPEANRIYIVGANEGDVEYYLSKPLADSEITAWQGNEEMLPGDIVLVYETTPFSRIGSVWRAVSPGFDDPFHYYPGKVYLSHPIKIPDLYFNALLHDPVWGKKPLVKAHMQGVNGKPVTCEEYEALKRMIKQRDPCFDLNKLPNPPLYSQFYREDLQTEKDIEEMLLNPLLEKLGYNIKKNLSGNFRSGWGAASVIIPIMRSMRPGKTAENMPISFGRPSIASRQKNSCLRISDRQNLMRCAWERTAWGLSAWRVSGSLRRKITSILRN